MKMLMNINKKISDTLGSRLALVNEIQSTPPDTRDKVTSDNHNVFADQETDTVKTKTL